MKKIWLSAVAATFTLAVMAEEGVVSAAILNLRLKPDVKTEVVGKAKKGDKLEIIKQEGDFFAVKAPESVNVYVSGVYLKDGKTTAEVTMRAADTDKSGELGKLPANTPVKVIKLDNSGWVKIVPPESVVVYAASQFVSKGGEIKADTKPAETKTAEVKADAKPAEVKPQEVKKDDAKTKKIVISAKTQKELEAIGVDVNTGKDFTAEGIIVTLKKDSATKVLTHALLKEVKTAKGSDYQTLYFIATDKPAELSKYDSKQVKITGKAFTVSGWKEKVAFVTNIE